MNTGSPSSGPGLVTSSSAPMSAPVSTAMPA